MKPIIEIKIGAALLLLGVLSGMLLYYLYSRDIALLTEEFRDKNEKDSTALSVKIKDKLLESDAKDISRTLEDALKTTNIDHIKVIYENFIFTKLNVLLNSDRPTYLDWEIEELTVDAKDGVVKNEGALYRLQYSDAFDIKKGILVKALLHKNGTLANISSRITFYFEHSKENLLNEKKDTNTPLLQKNLIHLSEPLATIQYRIDEQPLLKEGREIAQSYINYYIFLMAILSLFGAIYYLLYKKIVLHKDILAFKQIIQGALENNLANKIETSIGNKEIDEILALLHKVLRKYISVVNELNINKETLERKVFTDDLTGLPNQKVFELDLKNMFIVGSDGFIGSIKLEALGNYTKEHGVALANHLIEEFANIVQNKFYEFNFTDATLYRFFGSEFAIIIKNQNEQSIQAFSANLEEELGDLEIRYEVGAKLTCFSFIPFDRYGTIDSILKASKEAYNHAKELAGGYYIVSPSEVLDKFQFLEQNVREIIEGRSFEVSYGFPTKTLDEEERVIIKEAMPILYDKNKEKFAISVFISVAEKIGMAVKFDKMIIETVTEYIKQESIEYDIAISLSMHSLKDSEFINWLHSLFVYNENVAKKLIFSMTSYNVSTNIEAFQSFTDELHRFHSKVMLKRYSSKDFNLEQLEELRLDYLRISKDYTSAIAKDKDKKHFLRSIVNYGQSNDVMILGDSIKDAQDIQICANIGLDAVSN